MSNGMIPGIKPRQTRQDKFSALMKMIYMMQESQQKEMKFQAGATQDLIKVTNSLEGMEKLQNIVKEQDANWDAQGYDAIGDINVQMWGTKHDLMQRGQQGINYLSGDFFNITDVQAKTDEIIDMPWNEVSSMWQRVYGAAADITQAKQLGMKFKGADPTLMLAKATQFDNMFKNSLSVLAAQGVWEIPESMMEMTQAEFGVAMMTYDQPTFLRFMQSKESVSRGNIKNIENNMNAFYNQMINAQAQGGTSKSTVDIENFVKEGQSYKVEEYEQRYREQKTLLQTLNSRHNSLYGNYVSETPQALGTEGYGGGGSYLDEDVLNLEGAEKDLPKDEKDDKVLKKESTVKVGDDEVKINYKEDISTTPSVMSLISPKDSKEMKSLNVVKEGNVWKYYDDSSKSYKNLPDENIEKILINGKYTELPVLKAQRTVTKKGLGKVKETVITHILIKGEWRKASAPIGKTESERVKELTKRSRVRSGGSIYDTPIIGPLLDYPEIPTHRTESDRSEEQEEMWEILAKLMNK